MNLFKLLIICSLVTFYQAGNAQNLKKIKVLADAAIESNNYPEILAYTQEIIKAEDKNWPYYLHAAEAAFQLRAYPISRRLTEKLLEENDANSLHASAALLLAQNQMSLGLYAQASATAELALNGLNNDRKAMAQQLIAQANWALEARSTCQVPTTTPQNLESLNTKTSDFPIAIRNRNMQYASFVIDTSRNWCKCNDLCNFKMDWKRQNMASSQVDTFNFPASPQSLGHFSFAGDNHRVYYNDVRCDDSGNLYHVLYYIEQNADGWGEPVALPDHINVPGFSAKQPFLISNPEQDTDTLFFVSNRDGGKGNWDIWYTAIKNDRFAVAKNMEFVNTPGDEVTPFYNTATQSFYYSSNGRTESLGGFDIYLVDRGPCGDPQPANLGCSINSSFDDTYYIQSEDGTKAYFASNREGVQYDRSIPDFKNCCTDIFELELEGPQVKRLDLIVSAVNYYTQEPLLGVQFSVNPTHSEDPLSSLPIASNEIFVEHIPFNDTILAKGTKDRYLPDEGAVASQLPPCQYQDTLEIQLQLKPIMTLTVEVYDAITRAPITYNAEIDLNYNTQIDTVYLDNGTYSAFFELAPNTTYEVTTFKNKTSKDAVPFVSYQGAESIQTGYEPFDTTIILYLFNPLPLYFDHDFPKMASYSTPRVSKVDYGTAFNAYMSLKSDFLDPTCFTTDKPRVNEFFKNAEDAKSRLDFLAETIINRLESTTDNVQSVEITFAGSASSAGQSNYNQLLSERRIESVEKYLKIKLDQLGKGYLFNKIKIMPPQAKGSTEANVAVCQEGNRAERRCCSRYRMETSEDRYVEILDIYFKQ